MKEKLLEQLMAELSKRNVDLVTSIALKDDKIIHHLVDIALMDIDKASMRAAWALDKISQKKHPILENRLSDLYENLEKIPESGTRRCVLKVLMQYKIPVEYEGKLFDFGLQMIESPKEPVAVKANCMTLIFNLLPKYPELKNEVFEIIKNQAPHHSVGFKSRFNVLQKQFEKELKKT